MSAEQAKVEIFNLALEELGQDPIDDFSDESPGAERAEARYNQTANFILGLRTWSFQRSVRQLSRLAAAPSTGYDYAFEIPGDQRGVLSVFTSLANRDRPLREGWRVYEGQIHTNQETLWAELAITGTDPTLWPDVLRQAVIKGVAEGICMQHTANRSLKADLRGEAYGSPEEYPLGGLVGLAISMDGQAEPTEPLFMGAGPLLEVRD